MGEILGLGLGPISPYVRMVRLKREALMTGKWRDLDNVFTYIAAGKADFIINGIHYSLRAGNAIIISPYMTHVIVSKGTETLVQYIIHFDYYETEERKKIVHKDILEEEDKHIMYVDALAAAGVQAAMVKGRPHTGLANYPTKIGRMHKGLNGFDFLGTIIEKCHAKNIAVIAYFTQIFDNWAYDNHPEWRVVTEEGKGMKEYEGESNFKLGRYGIVCPNNPGYREYVKACLTEMNTMYDFESMFLDMTFFPEVCYCASCRKRYLEETGKELPRVIDWNDPDWREYADRRNLWMAEFARFSTGCVKSVKPHVTVEHQFSRITGSWIDGSTEMIMDAADYASGDYYGVFLQQSFINKYYKNVTQNLPFAYHTSRCDPELAYHTTTKTEEELLLHVITALAHNGAFLLVDAINPDGTIVPEVYHNLMKNIYDQTRQYEKYVSGDLYHDAAIWFASHAKYDPNENGIGVMEKTFSPKYYLEAPVGCAKICRENNIPFDVIAARNIRNEHAKVMVLPHIANIREEEMDDIESYLEKGGNLLISGPIANERLQNLLGVKVTGRTAHNFTYMSPTEEGKEFFEGFSYQSPLTIDMHQTEIEVTNPEGMTVLATQTLPYTMTGTHEFAAIHSNPPGVYTDKPCAVLKKVGNSQIIWIAAPIEMSRPYMSRLVYKRMLNYLIREPSFVSDAPKFVEVLEWKKEDVDYFAVINEQEESPIAPMYDITIEVKKPDKKAYLLPAETELPTEVVGDTLKIKLPKLEVFHMIKLA